MLHIRSTLILRRRRLGLVGRISEQARHTKFRTFGGVFNAQSFVQSLRSWPARECSPLRGLAILSTTWYADLIVKFMCLVSIQHSLSRPPELPNFIPRTASLVEAMNTEWRRALSHWRVLELKRLLTFWDWRASSRKMGGWGSHLWLATPTVSPSPIRHVEPSLISSLASNKLCQMYKGLLLNLASINEHVRK